jgi:hypothetical protein
MENESDLSTPAARLRWARKRANFATAEDAATRFGWKAVTYRSHETGQNGFSRIVAEYARAFKVQLAWLLTGQGDPDAELDPETAEVIWVVPKLSKSDRQKVAEYARLLAAQQAASEK